MAESSEWCVGTHHVEFKSPDILVARLRGWITGDDARQLVELTQAAGSHEPVYFVVSMEPMEGFPFPRLSVEGRRYLAANARSEWFKAILHVGGDIPQKITIKGLTLALMLTGIRTRFESVFPADLVSALAWIEEHRLKWRGLGATR